MSDIKILEHLGGNKFVVELPLSAKRPTTHVGIAHDYIQINGWTLATQVEQEDGRYPFENSSNILAIDQSLQIPILTVKQVLLPLLEEHKYLQDSHFQDGRYRYMGLSLSFWEDGVKMVKYRESGRDKEWVKVTEVEFNSIKNGLRL
mgnify:CR=1 FL=1